MFEVLAELRRGRKQLKEELEGLQTRVNEDNQSNADNLLPLLRVLHQGIKASSAEVKSQFYQLQRELDQIRREHNSTLQQLLFVQKLVMSTEKDMGMARKEQWPI
jgi:seryl-tRNA synthetase